MTKAVCYKKNDNYVNGYTKLNTTYKKCTQNTKIEKNFKILF